MKITRKRADRGLQKAITADGKAYAITSDPAALADKKEELIEALEHIENKIDRVISILSFIEHFVREGGKVDYVLDDVIDFLNKVLDSLDQIEDKI